MKSACRDAPVEVRLDNTPIGIEASRATAQPKPSDYKDNRAKLQQVDGTDVKLLLNADLKTEPTLCPLRIRARGILDGRVVERMLVPSTAHRASLTRPPPASYSPL